MTCKLKDRCKQGETCVAHNGYDIWRCTAFKDKGVPMTNEEYLKSCTTEQLAEVLNGISLESLFAGQMHDLPKRNGTKAWVEWLKQPRTIE